MKMYQYSIMFHKIEEKTLKRETLYAIKKHKSRNHIEKNINVIFSIIFGMDVAI